MSFADLLAAFITHQQNPPSIMRGLPITLTPNMRRCGMRNTELKTALNKMAPGISNAIG